MCGVAIISVQVVQLVLDGTVTSSLDTLATTMWPLPCGEFYQNWPTFRQLGSGKKEEA